jgi:hypothetical protein
MSSDLSERLGQATANPRRLRNEGVSQLVAQAISSHHDPKMHAHYSTISDAEKTGALAKVIRLFPSPLEPTMSSSVADRVADPSPDHAGLDGNPA